MKHFLAYPLAGLAVTGLACTSLPAMAQAMTTVSPNAIQPETTLTISAEAEVTASPDVAYLSGGVVSEASTAQEALRQNSVNMAGVYKALEGAGLAKKNIQTSDFSLQPVYNYPENEPAVLTGYRVSNQVMVKVEDLDNVGSIIDTMVELGGNTFNGVSFDIQDSSELQNEARRKAMQEAVARAELYAEASGYQVARIVTISETGGYRPQPVGRMVMAEASMAKSAPTQISGGELTVSAGVSVVFELTQ